MFVDARAPAHRPCHCPREGKPSNNRAAVVPSWTSYPFGTRGRPGGGVHRRKERAHGRRERVHPARRVSIAARRGCVTARTSHRAIQQRGRLTDMAEQRWDLARGGVLVKQTRRAVQQGFRETQAVAARVRAPQGCLGCQESCRRPWLCRAGESGGPGGQAFCS
ncbi:hypothetical protein EV126DRAFT_68813 [Verticillium dahliae]|nr:hypothetical protein EV126DRAFT_68813 [Verticillium dahliae]